MARIQRLILLLLLCLSGSAYASFPASGGPVWSYQEQAYSTSWPSPQQGCDYIASRDVDKSKTFTAVKNSSGSWSCYVAPSGAIIGIAANIVSNEPYTCPAFATLSGTTCTCNAGSPQSGSSCTDPSAAKCDNAKNGVDLFTGFKALPTFGASFCPSDGAASSCAAKVSGGFCVVKGGVKTCTHEVTYTGGTCTPPAPSPSEPSPTPTPCKGTYGQVNGVDVCLPLGTDPAATVETGKKTETTTTPSGGGAPTTTTTDEKATCIGSMCTTEKVTTTTGPDGVPTSTTEKKTESKDDYCKVNPRAPLCLTSSYGGGACGTQPTCDGDAIQCAVAAFTFNTQCALTTAPTSPEITKYNTESAKSQGDQTEAITTTVTIGADKFDQTDLLGDRGVLQDQVITVVGQSVTIPWSSGNVWLQRLGQVMQACTFLLCLRIVFRG